MDPKPSRIERKKAETHHKIISTAIGLFNRHGLDAVTMEQIAEEVDIAKGTLYNYFPSKEAIIAAYVQRATRERLDSRVAQMRALPDTRSRLEAILSQLVEGVQRQKDIFEAFLLYQLRQSLAFRPVPGQESTLGGLVHELITLGQQDGDLRGDLPEELLIGLFEYVMIAAVKPFYLHPETFNPREAVRQSVELYLRGAGK